MERSSTHGLVESIVWKWLRYQKNLHVQCYPHQNSNNIHHRNWKINPKFHLEAQRTLNRQGNTEQKEQHWSFTMPCFKLYYRATAIKASMVVAQKQTRRPVKQYRRSRYEFTQLHSPDFWQRHPKYTMEKRQPLHQVLLGKLDICMQKTETRSMSFTLYKYQLKVD
jgi:hypothetical protein